MDKLTRHLAPPAGDDLIAGLHHYAQDRADDSADMEQAVMQMQRLATVGRLATEVAHDFGNLMTVILGYSELILSAAEQGQPPSGTSSPNCVRRQAGPAN